MTTRLGNQAIESLTMHRGKTMAHLVRITRNDGIVVRMTDHDRTLTFEGETYSPAIVAGLSAERREASLRSGNQEARGLVDGSVITINDLRGNRYRGAEVHVTRVDWTRPWVWYAKHRKWIRTIARSGAAWVGTLEGRSQSLQRPGGGRHGGTFATTCPYQLGNVYCTVDLTPGAGFAVAGARVGTVTTPRKLFAFTGSVGSGFDDDFFRYGSIQWIWGPPEMESQTTATSTTTTLTDSTQTWTDNEHVGKWVRLLRGHLDYIEDESYARITENSATKLTFEAIDTIYASGRYYDICPDAANFNEVSEIASYAKAPSRAVELFLPPPFDIAVGDSGILFAGCDGLRTTCSGKFDNVINFGGDPYAPSSGQVIEPPNPNVSLAREQFLAAVTSCIGTPVMHRGRKIGVGLDCVGIIVASLEACGEKVKDRTDYGRLPSADQLRDGLARIAYPVAIADRIPGDILQVFAGREARHAAVMTGTNDAGQDVVVHAWGKGSKVIATVLADRIGACWRLRGLIDG